MSQLYAAGVHHRRVPNSFQTLSAGFSPRHRKKTNQVGLALRQPIQVEVIDWENSESEKNSGT